MKTARDTAEQQAEAAKLDAAIAANLARIGAPLLEENRHDGAN